MRTPSIGVSIIVIGLLGGLSVMQACGGTNTGGGFQSSSGSGSSGGSSSGSSGGGSSSGGGQSSSSGGFQVGSDGELGELFGRYWRRLSVRVAMQRELRGRRDDIDHRDGDGPGGSRPALQHRRLRADDATGHAPLGRPHRRRRMLVQRALPGDPNRLRAHRHEGELHDLECSRGTEHSPRRPGWQMAQRDHREHDIVRGDECGEDQPPQQGRQPRGQHPRHRGVHGLRGFSRVLARPHRSRRVGVRSGMDAARPRPHLQRRHAPHDHLGPHHPRHSRSESDGERARELHRALGQHRRSDEERHRALVVRGEPDERPEPAEPRGLLERRRARVRVALPLRLVYRGRGSGRLGY